MSLPFNQAFEAELSRIRRPLGERAGNVNCLVPILSSDVYAARIYRLQKLEVVLREELLIQELEERDHFLSLRRAELQCDGLLRSQSSCSSDRGTPFFRAPLSIPLQRRNQRKHSLDIVNVMSPPVEGESLTEDQDGDFRSQLLRSWITPSLLLIPDPNRYPSSGVVKGDILLAVNGLPIKTLTDIQKVEGEFLSLKTTELLITVRRANARRSWSVEIL